jgi:transposase-like protein
MTLTQRKCLAYFEKLRWGDTPTCPYCLTKNATPMPKEHRYHCGRCYTSFSVTVGTLFHHSHISLAKWFKAIFIITRFNRNISIRELAREISVTKETASSMRKKIRIADKADSETLKRIASFYEISSRKIGND